MKTLRFGLFIVTMNILLLIDASEYRRYNEIDVKLFSKNDETFQTKMRKVMEESNRFLLEDKIVDGISNIAGSFSDSINRVIQVLQFSKDLSSIDNEIINTLIKEIPIEIERSNVCQDILNMEARLATIWFNINYLNGSIEIENEVKKSIIHDMHNDLLYMVNIFDHHHSGFRKHPLLAVPFLFSLSPFVAVYNRLEASLNPQLASRSIIGCKIQRSLKEYQPLTIIDRLTKIQIKSTLIPNSGYGDSTNFIEI